MVFQQSFTNIAIPLEHDLVTSAAQQQMGQVLLGKIEDFSTKLEGQCETELLYFIGCGMLLFQKGDTNYIDVEQYKNNIRETLYIFWEHNVL